MCGVSHPPTWGSETKRVRENNKPDKHAKTYNVPTKILTEVLGNNLLDGAHRNKNDEKKPTPVHTKSVSAINRFTGSNEIKAPKHFFCEYLLSVNQR